MTRELDPYNFHLGFAGTRGAGFTEVSGVTFERPQVRERPRGAPRKRPQGHEIACKRGCLIDPELLHWVMSFGDAGAARTLELRLRAENGTDAACWTLIGAIVTKVQAPVFHPTREQMIVEAIHFSCARIRRHKSVSKYLR